MKARETIIGAALLLLLAGGAYAALWKEPALRGEIVDARSGRVAAGATITHGDRVLRRFRDKAFVFEGAEPGTLSAEAPGYEPVKVEVAAGSPATVRMTPVAIPGLSGVVVFPKASGTRIELTAQLLDRTGRAMPEFPAVDLAARLIIASKEGAPLAYLDLDPRVDYGGPEISIRLSAEREAIVRAAGPGAALLMVSLKVGETVVASRPFPLPEPSP